MIREEDGVKLGRINDVTLDVANGKVLNIIVSGSGRIFSLFSSKEQFSIPWNKIIKIGSDVIIVERLYDNKNMELDQKS